MCIKDDPVNRAMEGEFQSTKEFILENRSRLTTLHKEARERKADRLFRAITVSSPRCSSRTRRVDKILSDLIGNPVLHQLLRKTDPKIHGRMMGHLQSATRELSRLIRRQERMPFSRLLKGIGLDPEGPFPKNLVGKYGRGYGAGERQKDGSARFNAPTTYHKTRRFRESDFESSE